MTYGEDSIAFSSSFSDKFQKFTVQRRKFILILMKALFLYFTDHG